MQWQVDNFHYVCRPCLVDKETGDTTLNKHSWNNNASVIFLDQVWRYNIIAMLLIHGWISPWIQVILMARMARSTQLLLLRMCIASSSFSSKSSQNMHPLISMLLVNHVSNNRPISHMTLFADFYKMLDIMFLLLVERSIARIRIYPHLPRNPLSQLSISSHSWLVMA